MRTKNTIVINGKVYDAVSGLPAGAPDKIASAPAASTPTHTHAHAASAKSMDVAPAARGAKAKGVHARPQRSQTLRRDLLKAPQHAAKPLARRKPTPGSIAQSPHISRFAPHPQALPKQPTEHVAPAHHAATHHTPAATHHAKPQALSSRELKEKLISERLAAIQDTHNHKEHKAPKRGFFAHAPRVSSVVAGCFAIVLIGGYLTYVNMPNLSMHVAAANAGVDASFPDYRPDGYRFNGPIAYNNGEVSLKFASNTSTAGYTINQKNSNWDSQAVLDNYVTKKAKDYLTYSEQGLTIYTFDGEAAWVNGGVFYTIEGDAPLSSDQVLRIAGSM